MNKKAIAILGAIFLLIVGTLGFLLYSKYGNNNQNTAQNPTPTPTPQDNTPTPTPTPTVAASGFVKLTAEQVVAPVLFYKGDGLDYFDQQGNMFQAELQGNNGQLELINKKQVDIPAKPGVEKVFWPSDTQDFIVQTKDASGKRVFSYFNFETKSYIDLPSQITSLSWMPGGKQIVYVWLQDGKASLSIGSPDAKTYTKLTDLWETDDEIHVAPDASQILYFQTENTGINNNINSVSIDGKLFKGLIKNGQNYGVLWSPDSQKFLFGKKDPSKQSLQLWVYNLTSGEIRNLGLYSNVDKAVWDGSSNYVYVAVPNTPVTNDNALTVDTFYRIDIATFEKKEYPHDDSNPIDAGNMMLTPAGDKLFFKNYQDGFLYYLDLTQQ